MIHWQKYYTELPKGVYHAQIRDHHWEGYYLFQAIYDRGHYATECLSKDLPDLIAKADRWVAGEKIEGFYSSSI